MKHTKGTPETRAGIFFILLIAAGCVFSQGTASGAIPEPETLLYGKVINRSGGQEYLVTQGKMVWSIADHETGGDVFSFSTDLEPLANGQYSYRLRVPHEAVPAGQVLSPEKIPLSSDQIRYDHVSVEIDGVSAEIVPPARDFFQVDQNSRMSAYRIDLEVVIEPADTDGDGIPDWWEDEYGLDKNDPTDAVLDSDGDTASNLSEYLAGSDPSTDNRSPAMVTERILVYESAVTVVLLNVHDSDSAPADIVYTLTRAPEGGTLYVRDGSGQPDIFGLNSGRALGANDTFTHAEVLQGKLQFSHDDVSVEDISFDLAVMDENIAHASSEGTVTAEIRRPTARDGTEAAIWLDANYEAAEKSELTVWRDRSGLKTWNDGSVAPFDMAEIDGNYVQVAAQGPYGKPALVFDGNVFEGPLPDEATVLGEGGKTLFAVFKAEGDGCRKAVGNEFFDLAVAGENQAQPGHARYGTSGASVYSRSPAEGQWVLATARVEDGSVFLEIDGKWAGGPGGTAEINQAGRSFAVGGALKYRLDMNQGGWVTDKFGLFRGQIAEILAFDYPLSDKIRRKTNWSLLAKWFGYAICDASNDARNQTVAASGGLPDERGATVRVPSSDFNDEQYRAAFSESLADRRYVILGGPGDDTLSGGGEDDIIRGGPGNDILFGGAGSDLFVIEDIFDGNDVIGDFAVWEKDSIDFSSVLRGESELLSDYLRVIAKGTSTFIFVDADGQGGEYDDMVVELTGNMFTDEDLPFLWANGGILSGPVRFPLGIGLRTVEPNVVENSGEYAVFAVDFTGQAIPFDLNIPFKTEGTALWKTDYRLEAMLYNPDTEKYEPSELNDPWMPVRLKPGDRSLEIRVVPLADDKTEGGETATLVVREQSDLYDILAESSASVSILEGTVAVSIRALRGSIKEGTAMGDILTVSRSGPVDVPLEVFLEVTGSASNGTDYTLIPDTIVIPAGEKSVQIPIKPYADWQVEPVEYIQVFVVIGSGYAPGDPAVAEISIVNSISFGEPPVIGNLDNDNAVDMADAVLALQISVGTRPSAEVYMEADTNQDGRIGLLDALQILRIVAGTE